VARGRGRCPENEVRLIEEFLAEIDEDPTGIVKG
jgi:hypothetical protein